MIGTEKFDQHIQYLDSLCKMTGKESKFTDALAIVHDRMYNARFIVECIFGVEIAREFDVVLEVYRLLEDSEKRIDELRRQDMSDMYG